MVTLEIGNHMPSFITDASEIFRREIASIENQLLLMFTKVGHGNVPQVFLIPAFCSNKPAGRS